jgi:hypothetical protein
MYPTGGDQRTLVVVRGLSDILDGQFRPGHFDGVATVVTKLFGIVAPDVAVFGEKDYQQLLVMRHMTADLALPVEVVGAPTVRAPDGLALSSRNRYLASDERSRAPSIHHALLEAARAIYAGSQDFETLERQGAEAVESAGMKLDYFSIRNALDLSPPARIHGSGHSVAAARLRACTSDRQHAGPSKRALTESEHESIERSPAAAGRCVVGHLGTDCGAGHRDLAASLYREGPGDARSHFRSESVAGRCIDRLSGARNRFRSQ